MLRRRPLLRGDVPRDLGSAENLARLVAHRRNGQRDLDQLAVLAAAHGLEVVNLVTSAQAAQDALFFVMAVFWNDQRDGLSDGLGRRVAEQPFRPPIPGGYDAVEGLAEDRVVGILDNSGKPVGWEYDAVAEIAKRLNLSVKYENTSWDAMIPAVSAVVGERSSSTMWALAMKPDGVAPALL